MKSSFLSIYDYDPMQDTFKYKLQFSTYKPIFSVSVSPQPHRFLHLVFYYILYIFQ